VITSVSLPSGAPLLRQDPMSDALLHSILMFSVRDRAYPAMVAGRDEANTVTWESTTLIGNSGTQFRRLSHLFTPNNGGSVALLKKKNHFQTRFALDDRTGRPGRLIFKTMRRAWDRGRPEGFILNAGTMTDELNEKNKLFAPHAPSLFGPPPAPRAEDPKNYIVGLCQEKYMRGGEVFIEYALYLLCTAPGLKMSGKRQHILPIEAQFLGRWSAHDQVLPRSDADLAQVMRAQGFQVKESTNISALGQDVEVPQTPSAAMPPSTYIKPDLDFSDTSGLFQKYPEDESLDDVED